MRKPTPEYHEIKSLKRYEVSKFCKNDIDTIISNIISLMAKQNISQERLADSIDSTRQHVGYILRSRKGITVNVLSRIAFVFDVPLHVIVKPII